MNLLKHELEIRDAFLPLRFIAVGAAIVILDFSVSTRSTSTGGMTTGFRFDFINDVVGMLMILFGLTRLAKFRVNSGYNFIMRCSIVVGLLCLLDAVVGHFVFAFPNPIAFVYNLFGILKLVSVFAFGIGMMMLSENFNLKYSELVWKKQLLLMSFLWILPNSLLHVLSMYSILFDRQFNFDLGVLIIPILLLMLIPVYYFFVAIRTMMGELSSPLPLAGKML